MSKKPLASRDDLFAVLDRFPEPVARVASSLLYWSQLAQHRFRGRLGIYKPDDDIAAEIRKHPGTAGRLVLKVCAPPESSLADALFEVAYGPKPGDRSGRVRWLFRTALGDELIDKALALAEARHRKRAERDAATGGHRSFPPVTAGRSYRSPQNAATPIIQRDVSESQSEKLSFAQEQKQKPDPSKQERLQEEVTRLVRLWERACNECGRPTLAWMPSNVKRWSATLIELIQVLRLSELNDDDLLKRLRLLAGNLERLSDARGSHFMDYNRQGLMIESFVRYGQKLWPVTEAALKEEARRAKNKVSYFSDSWKAGKPAE